MYISPSKTKKTQDPIVQGLLICSKHQGFPIYKGCIDLKCDQQALYCEKCEKEDTSKHLSSHASKITTAEELTYYLSSEIKKRLHTEKSGEVISPELYKNAELNIRDIENNFKYIKQEIDQEIAQISQLFLQAMETIKKDIFKKIDKSNHSYRKLYLEYQKAIEANSELKTPPVHYEIYSNAINLYKNFQSKSLKDTCELINKIKASLWTGPGGTNLDGVSRKDLKSIEEILKLNTERKPRFLKTDEIQKKTKKCIKKLDKLLNQQISDFPMIGHDKASKYEKRLNQYGDHKNNTPFKFSSDHRNCIIDTPTILISESSALRLVDSISTLHERPLKSITFITESIFATGSFDSSIKIFDSISRKNIKSLYGHSDAVISLAKFVLDHGAHDVDITTSIKSFPNFSSSAFGFLLISGGLDKLINIWDLEFSQNLVNNPKKPYTLKGHENGVSSLCDLLDQATLASGDDGGNIILWDIPERKLVYKTMNSPHNRMITSIVLLKIGSSFGTSSLDGKIVLWRIERSDSMVKAALNAGHVSISNCKPVRVLERDLGAVLDMVGLLNNSSLLICSHEKGTVSLWDTEVQKEPIALVEGINDEIVGLAAIENKNNEEEFMLLAILKNNESICCIDCHGKILTISKLSQKKGGFIISSKSNNKIFQICGKSQPCFAILNQSTSDRTVCFYDIKKLKSEKPKK